MSDFLCELEGIIAQRRAVAPEESYVAKLMAQGTARIAQKVGEEGLETALAAMKDDRAELLSESADLLFHLLVLLNQEYELLEYNHHDMVRLLFPVLPYVQSLQYTSEKQHSIISFSFSLTHHFKVNKIV